MPKGHWSDCGLHNGPAMRPTWCRCGGFERKPSFWSNLKHWVRLNLLYAIGRRG